MIGFFDFVVAQSLGKSTRFIVVETKGRVFEGTIEKDKAMQSWCEKVSGPRGNWHYIRVNQDWYEPKRAAGDFVTFQDLVEKLL